MQVSVTTMTGKTFTVDVKEDTSIDAFREKILDNDSENTRIHLISKATKQMS